LTNRILRFLMILNLSAACMLSLDKGRRIYVQLR